MDEVQLEWSTMPRRKKTYLPNILIVIFLQICNLFTILFIHHTNTNKQTYIWTSIESRFFLVLNYDSWSFLNPSFDKIPEMVVHNVVNCHELENLSVKGTKLKETFSWLRLLIENDNPRWNIKVFFWNYDLLRSSACQNFFKTFEQPKDNLHHT